MWQSRNLQFLIFLILIAFGFGIRVYNLADKRIYGRDEAWYAFAASGALTRLSQGLSPQLKSDLRLIYPQTDMQAYESTSSNNVSGKPVYVLALAAASWIWGGVSVIPLLGLSVAAGTLELATVYVAARKVGLSLIGATIAMLILSTSFFHTYLSRMNYPHSLLILFCTLGITTYAMSLTGSSSRRYLFTSGVILGLALGVDPSFIIFVLSILVITIVHGFLLSRRAEVAQVPGRLLSLCLGLAIPVLLLEISYRLGHLLLPGVGVFSITGSYIGDLFHHGAEAANNDAYTFSDIFFFYPLLLVGLEGVVTFGLLALGLRKAWISRDPRLSFVALFFALVLILAALSPFKAGRSIAGVLPLVALVAAVGFEAAVERARIILPKPAQRVALAAVVMVLVGYNLYVDSKLIALHSGWPDAANYLEHQGRPRVIVNEVSDNAILAFYLKRTVTLTSDLKQADLADFYLTWGNYRQPGWEQFNFQSANRTFDNYPQVFRPNLAIAGDWPLLPWWAFGSQYPSSFVAGDDQLMLYRLPGSHATE